MSIRKQIACAELNTAAGLAGSAVTRMAKEYEGPRAVIFDGNGIEPDTRINLFLLNAAIQDCNDPANTQNMAAYKALDALFDATIAQTLSCNGCDIRRRW